MTQVQIPESLSDRIEALLDKYGYSTTTDFVREAVRDKVDELDDKEINLSVDDLQIDEEEIVSGIYQIELATIMLMMRNDESPSLHQVLDFIKYLRENIGEEWRAADIILSNNEMYRALKQNSSIGEYEHILDLLDNYKMESIDEIE